MASRRDHSAEGLSVAGLLRLLALDLECRRWPLFDRLLLLEAAEVLARIEREQGLNARIRG